MVSRAFGTIRRPRRRRWIVYCTVIDLSSGGADGAVFKFAGWAIFDKLSTLKAPLEKKKSAKNRPYVVNKLYSRYWILSTSGLENVNPTRPFFSLPLILARPSQPPSFDLHARSSRRPRWRGARSSRPSFPRPRPRPPILPRRCPRSRHRRRNRDGNIGTSGSRWSISDTR